MPCPYPLALTRKFKELFLLGSMHLKQHFCHIFGGWTFFQGWFSRDVRIGLPSKANKFNAAGHI